MRNRCKIVLMGVLVMEELFGGKVHTQLGHQVG